MSKIFNAAEVIDMGIEKERKRREFYALVAGSFKDKELKELFEKLAGWEAEHIKRFSEIRSNIENLEIAESYQGEFQAYMRATVDDMLYSQVSAKEFAKNVNTPAQAIAYGIGFEKDAIIFFNELLGYMEPAYRESVLELLNEEKKHLVYLTELKRRYA